MKDNDMNEITTIVTGGAQGIGRAIVHAFAQAGSTVVIADINDAAAKETAKTTSQATGQEVVAVETDVANLTSVQAMAERVKGRFGRIDVLVNNAGWDKFSLFLDTTPALWDKLIAINYYGVLNTCYAVLPYMVAEKSGAIVNIASDAGRGGSMGEAVYAGCKGAIIAFSKTIAREHGRDNIRVNVVAPGITNTAILQSFYETEMGGKVIDAIARSIPLGRRPGEPEEIAPAVLFLASSEARYITGQVLSVSGGLTMVD
jgi:2-hydroxycyclohexanecarboxyl-CoA dehydrogenase